MSIRGQITIRKGSVVHLTTTNGGAVTAPLAEHYVTTYGVCIEFPQGHFTWISADRIKTIEEVKPQ